MPALLKQDGSLSAIRLSWCEDDVKALAIGVTLEDSKRAEI